MTFQDYQNKVNLYHIEYDKILESYLKWRDPNSIWVFNDNPSSIELPEKGFKLHISSNILEASEILSKVAKFLNDNNILFKSVNSINELKKLNCGLYYGYSQIGKFITVYPKLGQNVVEIAEDLHQITQNYYPVTIPYDFQYKELSNVFYRYGNLVKSGKRDNRYNRLIPKRVKNPFGDNYYSEPSTLGNYIAHSAIIGRGKGGVFEVFDLDDFPNKELIMKVGYQNGEVEYDGSDGADKIRIERDILRRIESNKLINAPKVIDYFEIGKNAYLILEKIFGVPLSQWLIKNKSKIDFHIFLKLSIRICEIMYNIHELGLAWRDCKTQNFMIDDSLYIRPIDFEGGTEINNPSEIPYGTEGFIPPEWGTKNALSGAVSQDIYSLGITILQIAAMEPYTTHKNDYLLKKVKRKYPLKIINLIISMINEPLTFRPTAKEVFNELKNI